MEKKENKTLEKNNKKMDAFLLDHLGDSKAKNFIDRMKEEIAYYEENKDCFGYVFYIGRKV